MKMTSMACIVCIVAIVFHDVDKGLGLYKHGVIVSPRKLGCWSYVGDNACLMCSSDILFFFHNLTVILVLMKKWNYRRIL